MLSYDLDDAPLDENLIHLRVTITWNGLFNWQNFP